MNEEQWAHIGCPHLVMHRKFNDTYMYVSDYTTHNLIYSKL